MDVKCNCQWTVVYLIVYQELNILYHQCSKSGPKLENTSYRHSRDKKSILINHAEMYSLLLVTWYYYLQRTCNSVHLCLKSCKLALLVLLRFCRRWGKWHTNCNCQVHFRYMMFFMLACCRLTRVVPHLLILYQWMKKKSMRLKQF